MIRFARSRRGSSKKQLEKGAVAMRGVLYELYRECQLEIYCETGKWACCFSWNVDMVNLFLAYKWKAGPFCRCQGGLAKSRRSFYIWRQGRLIIMCLGSARQLAARASLNYLLRVHKLPPLQVPVHKIPIATQKDISAIKASIRHTMALGLCRSAQRWLHEHTRFVVSRPCLWNKRFNANRGGAKHEEGGVPAHAAGAVGVPSFGAAAKSPLRRVAAS